LLKKQKHVGHIKKNQPKNPAPWRLLYSSGWNGWKKKKNGKNQIKEREGESSALSALYYTLTTHQSNISNQQ
jgi:hypothetical protein